MVIFQFAVNDSPRCSDLKVSFFLKASPGDMAKNPGKVGMCLKDKII